MPVLPRTHKAGFGFEIEGSSWSCGSVLRAVVARDGLDHRPAAFFNRSVCGTHLLMSHIRPASFAHDSGGEKII